MRLAATRAAVLAAMRAGGSLAPARCRATKPDTITTPIAWIDTVSLGGPVKTLDGRVSITATVIVVTDGTNDAATNALDDYTDEIAAQLVEAGLALQSVEPVPPLELDAPARRLAARITVTGISTLRS